MGFYASGNRPLAPKMIKSFASVKYQSNSRSDAVKDIKLL